MRDAVRLGEYRVGEARQGEWVMYGLGSCIGLILCDPEQKLSAAAHILLPESPKNGSVDEPGKYVDTAVPFLAEQLLALGARRSAIYAQVAGGAKMLTLHSIGDIGLRNIESTRTCLRRHNIPLVAEIVGGNHGRTLWWNLEKGEAVVRRVGSEDVVLTPNEYVYEEVAVGGTHIGRR